MSTPVTFFRWKNLPQDPATHMSSYFDIKDLIATSKTSKNCQWLFRKPLYEKKLAAELLRHVFDASPKALKELLSQISPDFGYVVLTKSSSKEEYYSDKQKK
jgi:hypothetical protein